MFKFFQEFSIFFQKSPRISKNTTIVKNPFGHCQPACLLASVTKPYTTFRAVNKKSRIEQGWLYPEHQFLHFSTLFSLFPCTLFSSHTFLFPFCYFFYPPTSRFSYFFLFSCPPPHKLLLSILLAVVTFG